MGYHYGRKLFYPGFSGLVLPSSLCWQHRQDSDLVFWSFLGFRFVLVCHHRLLKHRQDLDLFFWSSLGFGFGFGFCHYRFLKHRQDFGFWFFSRDWILKAVIFLIPIIRFLIQRCGEKRGCTRAVLRLFRNEVNTVAIVVKLKQ